MKLKLKEIEVTKIDGSKQKLKLDYNGTINRGRFYRVVVR